MALFSTVRASSKPGALHYYFYAQHFDRVSPFLVAMLATGEPSALESWARLSALSALSGRVELAHLNEKLIELGSDKAWHGACAVWFANAHDQKHTESCMLALAVALETAVGVDPVLNGMQRLFREDERKPSAAVPLPLLRRALERSTELKRRGNFHGLEKWCFQQADSEPMAALEIAEAFSQASRQQSFSFDGPEALPGLLTTLFREAEEREATDEGEMLRRVVQLQDHFLKTDHESLRRWLRNAERGEA